MSFPVLNGGVMMLVFAGLLFLLLKPKSDETSATVRSVAKRSWGRRLTGWASLLTLTVTLASLFFLGEAEGAWLVPVSFGAATLLLFLSNLLIARSSGTQKTSRRSSRTSRSTARIPSIEEMRSAQRELEREEQELIDSRGWQPQSIPKPLYRNDLGTLEQAELAEIVSFDEISRKTNEKYGVNSELSDDATRINLDEILRRRRANGN